MYPMNPEGNAQVFQQITENQQTSLFQATPVTYVPNLQTSPMACFQMPQPPSGTAFPLYEEMYNYMQQYWIYSLPGVPTHLTQDRTVTLPSVHVTSPTLLPTAPRSYEPPEDNVDMLHGPNPFVTARGSVAAGDLGNYQLRNPASNSVKSDPEVGTNGSQKPFEVALQKRELRLLKNREAARECRRKKKEYVRCLENRVAVLEQQNKTLIEELRALKDIYRHKAE